MHEILRHLPPSARVLDLGSNRGSFDVPAYRFVTIRADLEPAAGPSTVCCDAALLPFRNGGFDAVISNHSLEHFHRLQQSLSEIGRVIAPGGALYVAVPDARTFSDRLYRWLGRGGGHVNAFTSAHELAGRIEQATGLPCAATRLLHTSLSFLNRRNIKGSRQKKLWLFAGGDEEVLAFLSYVCRRLDGWFGTRLSVYGWAFWFGQIHEAVDTRPYVNVCVRCGSGHAEEALSSPRWRCAQCGGLNWFTRAR